MRTWIAAIGLGASLIAGCSSNDPAQASDGAAPDGGATVVDSSLAADSESADTGASPSEDASPPTPGCFAVSGSGVSQTCAFTTLPANGTCGSVPGTTLGSCPTNDLQGCCIKYPDDGGTNDFTASCSYSNKDAGQAGASACAAEAYEQGGQYVWDPSSP
jgi:hypothetical protein